MTENNSNDFFNIKQEDFDKYCIKNGEKTENRIDFEGLTDLFLSQFPEKVEEMEKEIQEELKQNRLSKQEFERVLYDYWATPIDMFEIIIFKMYDLFEILVKINQKLTIKWRQSQLVIIILMYRKSISLTQCIKSSILSGFSEEAIILCRTILEIFYQLRYIIIEGNSEIVSNYEIELNLRANNLFSKDEISTRPKNFSWIPDISTTRFLAIKVGYEQTYDDYRMASGIIHMNSLYTYFKVGKGNCKKNKTIGPSFHGLSVPSKSLLSTCSYIIKSLDDYFKSLEMDHDLQLGLIQLLILEACKEFDYIENIMRQEICCTGMEE